MLVDMLVCLLSLVVVVVVVVVAVVVVVVVVVGVVVVIDSAAQLLCLVGIAIVGRHFQLHQETPIVQCGWLVGSIRSCTRNPRSCN